MDKVCNADPQAGRGERIAAHRPRVQAQFGARQQQDADPGLADRPVAAVGARWGYPDPAHFSRLFKSAYGIGPRDYRYHSDASGVNG